MSQDPSYSSQPLRVGMIGVGGFGGYRRARMRESGRFQLVACHDRNAETLTRVAAAENAAACGSVESLLATPGLEGLVISTGVDSHVPLAVEAMRAGLHVFVEKPLCGRAEEVAEVLKARDRYRRVVSVGHAHAPTDPVLTLVKTFIEQGRLGTVVAYEENTSHSGGLEIKPGDWRGIREKNPGGMLLQCGVHALHSLFHLFGPVDTVACMMRYDAHPGTQTADAACAVLRHKSGLIGTLNAYHVTAYCHEFRIFGTAGNLYIDTHLKRRRGTKLANATSPSRASRCPCPPRPRVTSTPTSTPGTTLSERAPPPARLWKMAWRRWRPFSPPMNPTKKARWSASEAPVNSPGPDRRGAAFPPLEPVRGRHSPPGRVQWEFAG